MSVKFDFYSFLRKSRSDHFGDDATVDEKTFQTISSYLNENSAEKSMQYKRSRKIVENLNGSIPDSISKMPYMKKKHKDIKEHLITQKEVKGLFNCTACHQNAKKVYLVMMM